MMELPSSIGPLWRAIRLVRELAPRLALGAFAVLVVDAFLVLGTVYALQMLVVSMELGRGDLSNKPAELVPMLSIAAGVFIAAAISRALSTLVSEHLSQTVSDRVESLLNRRVARADLALLEDPTRHDLLQRAMLAGGSRPAQVISNLFGLAQNGLLLAGMAALLVSIHWLLIALLTISLVPGTLVRLQQNRVLHEWQVRRTRTERHAHYLRWLLTDRHGAKEVRNYGLADYFAYRFDQLRDLLRAERLAIGRRRMWIELSITLSVTAAFFGVVAWLSWRAVHGDGSFADLVLFLLVFMRGQGAIVSLKTSLAALFDDNLYLRALFEFIDVPDRVADPIDPMPVSRAQALSLHSVSFTYPGTSVPVLDGVSLTVPAGGVVAIVGANGSGKSTLIKLICRFYDPDAGEVRWGADDVRRFRRADYRRRIGVLFQDYVNYDTTLSENIRYGDIALSADASRIADAGRLALVEEYSSKLPAREHTHLGRLLEDGHELSVGQWQRLALARALVSDSDLLILDEPTSAMDPDAEARLFGNFRAMLGRRSALVISHRLSIVRGADYIYVMRDGRIVEEGTHDELMARRGGYHDLFMAQAQAYRVGQPG
jgi:ATP-binding cassette subfamily B protein